LRNHEEIYARSNTDTSLEGSNRKRSQSHPIRIRTNIPEETLLKQAWLGLLGTGAEDQVMVHKNGTRATTR
jgi:hypothetical protein